MKITLGDKTTYCNSAPSEKKLTVNKPQVCESSQIQQQVYDVFVSAGDSGTTSQKTFFSPPNMPKQFTFPNGHIFELYKNGKMSAKDLILLVSESPSYISDVDYNLFIDNLIPLTKYDTPKILETRKKFKNIAEPLNNTDELISKTIKIELSKLESIPSNRVLIVVCGLPGSGKNTLISQQNQSSTHYLADTDELKNDFKNILGADEFSKKNYHPLSRYLLQEIILPEAFKQGKNIILPTTGLYEYIERIKHIADKYNYSLKLQFVYTDVDKSIQRALSREQRTGLFTDPVFIYKRNQQNRELLLDILKLKNKVALELYDNNDDSENYNTAKMKQITFHGRAFQKITNNNLIIPRLKQAINRYKHKYSIKEKYPIRYKIKQASEFAIAGIMSAVTLPLVLFSMAMIKLESEGPALFKQIRIGLDGKPFVIYKLRTKIKDAQKIKNTFERGKDPRVTKVGKFLRKYGIDEFPQFWNVLQGRMAIIGPRPFIIREVNQLKPQQMFRYANKPGMGLLSYSYFKSGIPENLKSTLAKTRTFTHDEFTQIEKLFYKNWSLKNEFMTFVYYLRDCILGRHT